MKRRKRAGLNSFLYLRENKKMNTNERNIFLQLLFEEFQNEFDLMRGSEREKIVSLIESAMNGRFEHRLFPNERIFGFDEHLILRKINKRNYSTLIDPFFQKVADCWNRFEHITNAYAYTQRMEDFLTEYSLKLERKELEIKGFKREIQINVYQSIQFLKFINELIAKKDFKEYNKVIKPKNKVESLNGLLNKRDELCRIIDSTNEKKYKDSPNSRRLFMVSNSNLQMCSSDIRKVVLSGLGNYDYDIVNCHFSIIFQLLPAERYGDFSDSEYLEWKKEKNVEFSELKKLYENPTEYKKNLAEKWLVSIHKAKQILTSLVNGGAQSWSSKCFKNISVILEQTRTQQEMILNSGEYIRLKNEFRTVRNVLFELYHNKYSRITKQKFVPYLLSDYERIILDVVTANYNIELQTFDGFIVNENIEEKELEMLIEKNVGLKIKYKKESLDFRF